MNKKKLFKYKQGNKTIVSPHVPDCEYTTMLRLTPSSEDLLITDGLIFTTCIDIVESDLEIWYEVDKNNLDVKISTVEELKNTISNIEVDVATNDQTLLYILDVLTTLIDKVYEESK